VTSLPLKRTEYRDLNTGTIRGGATGHGESVTDVENYLMPLAQVDASSLRSWGVVDGLQVTAERGQRGVTVAPGVGLDTAGHLVVVARDGFAIVDPNVDPNEQRNIPTVVVGAGGVTLATAGLNGEFLLTLTWREVLGGPTSAPVLLHAPWLRLQRVADVPQTGTQVIMALATLDANGNVTALSASGRKLAGVATGRLELRRTSELAGSLGVDHVPAAELAVRPDGGVELTALPPNAPARTALSLNAATGNLALVPGGGNVGIGIGADAPGTRLHVEGNEIHTGGTGGGMSFASRDTPVANQRAALTDPPRNGERWVWYARGGIARLWSGSDLLMIDVKTQGGGLDVSRRMRVRKGGDDSAGIWFNQGTSNADRAFVGMRTDQEVGLFGIRVGWGMVMNVDDGTVTVSRRLDVSGQSCAQVFCNLSDGRLKTDVAVLDRPLERLARLRGVTFRWNPDAAPAGGDGIGVIAQEVAEVFPQLVSSMGERQHLTVDYSGLAAVLLEAVKELDAENRRIRTRLDALELA
jgi:hypothetical protein